MPANRKRKSTVATKQSKTFSRNYRILQSSVEQLRKLDVEDLDKVITLVNQVTTAYRACSSRLESVMALMNTEKD